MLYKKQIRIVFFCTILFIASIMVFGMPMASILSINTEYKSLYELNAWQDETQLKVYEYRGFTPELIWAYGKTIPMIENKGVLSLPEEDIFAVLISKENLKPFEKTFKGYSVEKITRYDMNPKGTESRSHRPRLWRDLYVVRKP
jgi:hypothetical protein